MGRAQEWLSCSFSVLIITVFSFGQVQKDIGDVEHGRSENVSSVHHTGNSHQQEVWGYEVQCHWCLWQPHIKILSILSTKSLCYIFKPTAIETEYRGPPVRMTTLPPRLCFSAPSLPCHVPNPHCCWGWPRQSVTGDMFALRKPRVSGFLQARLDAGWGGFGSELGELWSGLGELWASPQWLTTISPEGLEL